MQNSSHTSNIPDLSKMTSDQIGDYIFEKSDLMQLFVISDIEKGKLVVKRLDVLDFINNYQSRKAGAHRRIFRTDDNIAGMRQVGKTWRFVINEDDMSFHIWRIQ